MELIKKAAKMREWSEAARAEGKRIGFVPTMGYLHEGHLSLMRFARLKCDKLVVSVFVNPTQFAPSEDLEAYPRDLKRDMRLMEPIGIDAVFNPGADEMYPSGAETFVEVGVISKGLCGAFRPVFFRGVATVVAKLFNVVLPHLAVFGQKDYQQLLVIKRMVNDLLMDVEIVGQPIIREADGLAMSSRNTYLSDDERRQSLSLFESLKLAQKTAEQGVTRSSDILEAVKKHIEAHPDAKVQYAELVDTESLENVEILEDKALLALSVFVGKTRLIDNMVIKVGGS